ncbi:MAG: tRNA (5-methylaminomethyl-2-thiouridine)(34)-methyltransferase MnmD [Ferruginibacter sp.]|nr:tRNA (5-methylaminomethyl-2-thiouridine)(34)-methyltransferase MnmD [Cytophagales bacterium]
MNLEIRPTRDGSPTLYNRQLGKTYHSVHGAVQESVHVYIRAGLDFVLERKRRINLLEIGLGTGLNALLTIQQSGRVPCEIRYTSLEPCPVPTEITDQLDYAQCLGETAFFQPAFHRIHQASWEQFQKITENFSLLKRQVTLADFNGKDCAYDLIYFDPFPPSAHPDLWEEPTLAKLSRLLVPGGVLTTYCSKGQVKRNLRAVGLDVQALPGPPGKREMTRAVKPEAVGNQQLSKSA